MTRASVRVLTAVLSEVEEASRSECDLEVKFDGLYRRKEGRHDFVLYTKERWDSSYLLSCGRSR